MMKDFNQQADLVKQVLLDNAENVDFADFGDGTSDEWIRKAEVRLGVNFPLSYRWWLKNYRGGQIYGDEIYSIYELDFDQVVGGDIVYMNELIRRTEQWPSTRLELMKTDQGERYFMDLSHATALSEPPIYVAVGGDKYPYAAHFFDFLIKQLSE
jgi:hypothetical protein